MNLFKKRILLEIRQKPSTQLTLSLSKQRPIVKGFLKFLFKWKLINIDSNTKSDESQTTFKVETTNTGKIKYYYSIILGTAFAPEIILEREIFDRKNFNNQQILEYKMLREICKCMYFELERTNNQYLNSFKNAAGIQNLQIDGKFFTPYGSYKSGQIKKANPDKPLSIFENDIVELLSMYLWDSDYLKRFMAFLINTDEQYLNLKKAFGVRSLSPANASIIQELIVNMVKSLNL